MLPIESARARFLQIVVDSFINDHVIELADTENYYTTESEGQDKLTTKRKLRDIQYEGDPRFALPLMYIANMYETLVNDVNLRLTSLSGIREKTIGVALEASGGLYRCLAKKFPKKGIIISCSLMLLVLQVLIILDRICLILVYFAGIVLLFPGSCVYKRRELATSLETRTRFPELVIQDEKRVRFVVVNGLDIVEKPNNVPIEDAEW